MRLLRYLPLGVLALLVGGVAGFWWLGGDEAQRWLARNALEIALEGEVRMTRATLAKMSAN